MKKCDFCKCYDPMSNSCHGYVGDDYCDSAAVRFLSYLRTLNEGQKTTNVNKNVNVRKR